MISGFMFLNNGNNVNDAVLKRLRPHEVARFLNSYPEITACSVWETMRNIYGDRDQPPTWWLTKNIKVIYGPNPIWIKVPVEMLELVEAAKQPPKRRWRLRVKWRKLNNKG